MRRRQAKEKRPLQRNRTKSAPRARSPGPMTGTNAPIGYDSIQPMRARGLSAPGAPSWRASRAVPRRERKNERDSLRFGRHTHTLTAVRAPS